MLNGNPDLHVMITMGFYMASFDEFVDHIWNTMLDEHDIESNADCVLYSEEGVPISENDLHFLQGASSLYFAPFGKLFNNR